MLLKKILGRNYLVGLFILLGITTVLVVSAFAITAFFPEALGHKPYSYEIGTVCEFEPWAFETNDLKAEFPDGGIIAVVGKTEHKRSIMLLGEGTYEKNGEQLESASKSGIFMMIECSLFEEIRGDNIFTPVDDGDTLEHVSSVFEQQKGIPAVWEDTIPISFHPREGMVYYYFISEDGEPMLPPETETSSLTLLSSFSVYALFIAIMIMAVTILTLDHHHTNYWLNLIRTPPTTLSLGLVPLLGGMALLGELTPEITGWPDYYTAPAYAAALLILVTAFRSGKIDYPDLGLRRERIKSGYFLAVILAGLIIMSVRGLPEGLSFNGTSALSHFAVIFLLIALPREMLWRGYIQTVLSRRFGLSFGVLLTVLLVAAAHFIFLMITSPWMIAYPYTYIEAAVLVPGTAAILGYFYLRTENILACALLHSLIVFLPGYLYY